MSSDRKHILFIQDIGGFPMPREGEFCPSCGSDQTGISIIATAWTDGSMDVDEQRLCLTCRTWTPAGMPAFDGETYPGGVS